MHNDFRKKIITELGMAAGAIVLFLIIFIGLRFDINKRISAIKEARRDLASRLEIVERTAVLKKDRETAQRQRLVLEELLPTPEKLIDFSKKINSLAKKNHADVSFSFGQEQEGSAKKPGYISFTITATADFADWLKFMEGLEQLPYLIDLDSANLVAADAQYKSIINGKVFSQ